MKQILQIAWRKLAASASNHEAATQVNHPQLCVSTESLGLSGFLASRHEREKQLPGFEFQVIDPSAISSKTAGLHVCCLAVSPSKSVKHGPTRLIAGSSLAWLDDALRRPTTRVERKTWHSTYEKIEPRHRYNVVAKHATATARNPTGSACLGKCNCRATERGQQLVAPTLPGCPHQSKKLPRRDLAGATVPLLWKRVNARGGARPCFPSLLKGSSMTLQ